MVPLSALAILAAVYFYDLLAGGGLLTERDLGIYFIPPRVYWAESILQGELPLWNPYNFAGHPLFATLQPAILYPFNLLLLLFPFAPAFNGIIILHFFLAGVATFALLRELQADEWSAFFGALVFMLGGYLLSLHNLLSALLSVAWTPLVLLLFLKALRGGGLRFALWSGIMLAMSLLAGGVEIVLGTALMLLLMAVMSSRLGGNGRFGAVNALIVCAAVLAGLPAIQTIPFLELTAQSIRKDGLGFAEAVVWSASPVELLSFFVPDIYGSSDTIEKYWTHQSWLKTLYLGGIPFLLAAFYVKHGGPEKWFWLGLFASGIFLALGGYNPLYPFLFDHVPVLNKIRYPVKFLFLTILSLSVMAGLGLKALRIRARVSDGRERSKTGLIVSVFAAATLGLLNLAHEPVLDLLRASGFDAPGFNRAEVNLYNAKRMFFYLSLGGAAMWFVGCRRGSPLATALLSTVLIFDLFGNVGYYERTAAADYRADNWTVRTVAADLGNYRTMVTPLTSNATFIAPDVRSGASSQRLIIPSMNLLFGIRDMWGAEVMRVKRTDDLYGAMTAAPSIDGTRVADLFSVKYVISTKMIRSERFALVGADTEGLEGSEQELLAKTTIKIYRNRRALPRARIVERFIVQPDPSKVLLAVSERDFDAAGPVILEETPVWAADSSKQEARRRAPGAHIVYDGTNSIVLSASAARPSLLYLADTYYPGWKAYVDGVERNIYRANYNFRAVALSPGEHLVEFRYQPLSFYLGAAISALTVVILASLGVRSLVLRQRIVPAKDAVGAMAVPCGGNGGENGRRSVTRGYGLLEKFLAGKRAKMADRLMPGEARAGRLLDIGCGTTPYFLARTEFREKFGIDLHVHADMHDTSLHVKEFDLQGAGRLPFDDGFFDAVTMLAVFEHVEAERLPGLIGEIHRILKPGGALIITTPAPWTGGILKFMAATRLASAAEIDDHKAAYAHDDIRRSLIEAGFRDNDVRSGHFELFMNQWVMATKGG